VEIGGCLVVDNMAMGSPSMGGIRALPDITPVDIQNLARGMTLKNGAADLPFGGGKSGIVTGGGLSAADREKVIAGFARLLRRYRRVYVPGPDVGTNDSDMKTIALINGLDSAVSKPGDMGGNRIDELGGAAGGVVIAMQTLLEVLPRLRVLPQFADMVIPGPKELTVIIQGFGAVGAHAARIMTEEMQDVRIVGISDLEGYLYDENGLPIERLFDLWKRKGLVTNSYYAKQIAGKGHTYPTKFSTNANNLLRESAFCLVPATAVFNYLGALPSEAATMSIDRMGKWLVIVEGANTYSPDPNRKASRIQMEQIVYRQKGVMIATDYLVNSGGVIFAAQEQLVKTPANLQIPPAKLGNRTAVNAWLEENAAEFAVLSERRLEEGTQGRQKVIRHNMVELVDMLAGDADLLPCGAAERISVQRLTARESRRTAVDIMIPIRTVSENASLQAAATEIVADKRNMIAVLSADETLVGVVTAWDITRAAAEGTCDAVGLSEVMSPQVITAAPEDKIIDVVRKLEQNRISAMPVVADGRVLGMVNSDLLTHRTLLQMLQSDENRTEH
jgi:glutamate dehydrogenase (NAD(P)+)